MHVTCNEHSLKENTIHCKGNASFGNCNRFDLLSANLVSTMDGKYSSDGGNQTGYDGSKLFEPSYSDNNNILKEPAQTVKTRKRGFSLRAQLLNKSMHKQASNYLEPIKTDFSNNEIDSTIPTPDDIELKSVENTYVPDDVQLMDNEQNNLGNNLNNSSFLNINDSNNNNSNITDGSRSRKNSTNIRYNTLMNMTNESIIDLNEDDYLYDPIIHDYNSKNHSQNQIQNNIRLSLDNDNDISNYNNQNNTRSNKSKFKINLKTQLKFFKKVFIILTGGRPDLPSVGGRKIPISFNLSHTSHPTIKNKKDQTLLIDERNNFPYVDNTITSSRYTLISFLPRQLFAQFSKIANCYFLLVAILQLIPSWSTTGTSTTIIPLSIFISISMMREGWEDIKRHKLDKEENNRCTKVLKETGNTKNLSNDNRYESFSKSTTSFSRLRPSGQSFDFNFEEDSDEILNRLDTMNSFNDENLLSSIGISTTKTKWKNLKVGDIVKLEADDWVPADIILLTSTNEMGEAFIETMALDGETNLKSRIPNIELHKLINKGKNLFNLSDSNVLSEDPNLDLYNFEGSLDLPDLETQEMKTYPLGPDNIIYRGSIIRNTDTCLGLVVFTGEESKIRMNAIKNPRIKAPKLQRKINMIVLFMVIVVLSLSCFSLMAERIFYNKYGSKLWYTDGTDVGVAATVMGFIIMFNTMIPLSLYVTMEIIKAVQMLLMQWDIDMYHLPSDTPCEARTATILEELGQVSYIFSDKTGTLTDNVMLFRKFSVCGVPWIHDIDLIENNEENDDTDDKFNFDDIFSNKNVERTGTIISKSRPSMATLTKNEKKLPILNKDNSSENIKSTIDFIKYIQLNPNTLFSQKAKFFLLSIALCHTCLPRRVSKDDDDDDNDLNKRDSIDSLDDIDTSRDDINDENFNPFEENVSENFKEDEKIEYQASSPDELALVQAACDMGFILFDRKQKNVTLKTYPNGFESKPEFTHYEILDIVEFTSARKRMSVIVKFPNDKIILFCKGADNIIMERLDNDNLVKEKQSELNRSISQRKKAEAEFILNRKSLEFNSPKNSISSIIGNRLSLSSINNINSINNSNNNENIYNNISSVLNGDDDINELIKESKKSIDLQKNKKWNLSKNVKNINNYIPKDNLINDDNFLIERTLQHIDEFSSDGLRTLLYSYKYLDSNEYFEWSKRYANAKTSLVDRSNKIEKIGAELENNLKLLGCTAIEDKLQDGVPEAIEKLRRAGIKMWMLTGDKRETAINIGYSCKLIKDYSNVVILSNMNGKDLGSIITATEIEIDSGNIAHCVIVIDGSTLTDIENDDNLMSLFISLCVKSNSVICCRASPSQKATMVLKVRSLNKNKVTLAIGDGANDIAMIQSADVGIGITGKEGLQAARTSDYSIAQFKYLLKLLLVHGRYNYIRTSKFVLCTFYKELLFYLTQLLYQRYTLFTGSSLYESWSLSMFNTLFTSLPVLVIGMFEKDLKPSTLISIPELYLKGINNETFNLIIFIKWVLLATIQSTLLCFTLWYIYGFYALIDNTTYPLGVIMFTVLIIIINTKCNIIEMHTITKLSIISWIISVFGWFIWCMLLVLLYKSKINTIFYVQHGLFEEFGTDYTFWFSLIILIIFGLFIDLIFNLIKLFLIKLSDSEIFQYLENDKKIEKKMEINSFNELKQGWTWLHESQLRELDNYENESGNDNKMNKFLSKENEKLLYKFRSFMKKGSTKTSKHTQFRMNKETMINPTDTPIEFPSIIKTTSNEEYVEELLPSGKIIKIRKDEIGSASTSTSNYKKFFTHGKSSRTDDINIDEILKERQFYLDEYNDE